MNLIPMKWLWDPHVGKPEKNTLGMGVHKIVEYMEKCDLENRKKTISGKKMSICDTELKSLWTSTCNTTQFVWKYNIV